MSFPARYHHDRHGAGLALVLLASGAIGAYAMWRLMAAQRAGRRARYTSPSARRTGDWRESTLVGRTVTINRPRDELYAFWRDFSHLPEFMENVKAVSILDDKRSHWTIIGPNGRNVSFTSTITEEQPGKLIAWQSDEGAEVRNSGRIVFRDAPAGRGTEVEATIAYDPPGGTVGRLTAKLFQREPNVQARRDLKRFKQLMETGEVSVSRVTPAV